MTTFTALAKEGKLDFGSPTNLARLHDHLRQNEGKEYRVEKVQYKRSKLQNNFYWSYLGLIERETGNNANDLHEIFKRMFLPPRFVLFKGKEVRLPSTTTNLSKLDFGDYMTKISAYTEIAIPDPKLLGISQHDAILKDNEQVK